MEKDVEGISGKQSNFSSKSQFLVVTRESLVSLFDRLHPDQKDLEEHKKEEGITELCLRFRPNVVVQGLCPAYEEDFWSTIRIEGINPDGDDPDAGGDANLLSLRFHSQCTRCQMICINTETQEIETEPLKTLSEFRQPPGCRNKVNFGIYFSIVSSSPSFVMKIGSRAFASFSSSPAS